MTGIAFVFVPDHGGRDRDVLVLAQAVVLGEQMGDQGGIVLVGHQCHGYAVRRVVQRDAIEVGGNAYICAVHGDPSRAGLLICAYQ